MNNNLTEKKDDIYYIFYSKAAEVLIETQYAIAYAYPIGYFLKN